MFERYESVLERIGVVTRRFRATLFWWSVAIIAAFTSSLGIWLLIQARSGDLPSGLPAPRIAMALLLITAVGAIVALYLVRFTYRNPRSIAERIESRFPGLQQRLLTALSQSPGTDGQPLGYLQRRVITDAFRHSQTHRWTEAVPRGAAMLSRLTGGLSLLVLAIVTTLLFITKPSESSIASSRNLSVPQIVIEPGSTEVEKGSGLVVSARFASSDLIPDQLDLFTHTGKGIADEPSKANRIAMTQSLDDPLMSAYVPTIESPFQYQVASSRWQSETYSVEVFEYPNLTRADAFLDFPDYTQLETKRIEDTVRVTAVEGTKLQWSLLLNKPVATISIQGKDGTPLEVDATTSAEGRASFEVTLSESERWTIELTDEKGRKNKYPLNLDARVSLNQPPDLKLAQGGDLVASPLEEVSLVANVQDDFGVIRAGITYSMPDGDTRDVVIAESIARRTKQRLEHVIELEQMKAKPDDLVAYHFWVEDHAADGSVRRTPGDLYFVEVGPFEEIFREGESPSGGESPPAQQGGSQQSEELAELQKQIIAATWKVIRDREDPKVSKTFITDAELLTESQGQAIELASELAESSNDEESKQLVETLTGQMQTAVQQLQEATTQVSKSPLTSALNAEQAAYQTLLRLRAREFQVSKLQQQQGQQSGSASAQQRQQQLDQLELENDENRYETQSQATEANAQEAQSEDRQILNRLRELAQRQEDINKQLAQLQSAIEEAKTEEEKEEARRQLKRLREQEQELLRESDELADQMQEQENSAQQNQQADQLEETRENLRRSSEALEQDNVSEALAAGTRVERELDELSEEFRKRAAGEFDEAVRELRSKARELEEAQKQVGAQLSQLTENTQPGLRAGDERESIQQTLDGQKTELGELMQKVQQTVEEAEPSEPLLAQDLYETFRKTQQKRLDQQMTNTGEMLKRGLDPEAQRLQQQVAEGTSELRRDLEKAADSVLGNEAKALERALNELERLDESLQSELAQNSANTPPAPGNPGESSDANDPEARSSEQAQSGSQAMSEQREPQEEAGQQRQGEAQREPGRENQQPTPSESQAGTPPSTEGQPSEAQQGGPQQGQPQPGQSPSEQPSPGGRGQAGEATQRGGMLDQLSNEASAPAAGSAIAAPIAGGGFREFSDGLRDVEEMIGDPTLRSEAAVIRDRARQMRSEMRRHASEPQWELVESMIAKPLRELKMKVSEELLRRTADRAEPVPIDRDPVPDEYSNAVKRYYESLGSGR
jgi:hypothetical protein